MSSPTPITKTDFNFTGQTSAYHGKVRDMYRIGDDLIVAVVSDRISAFDVVMPVSYTHLTLPTICSV